MPPILPALAPGKGDTNSGALQGCGCRRCHADRVVSGAALDDDAIAARARIEVQPVVRGLRTEDVDRRPDAADRDAAVDAELVCGRGALDVDDVCSPVIRQVGVELAESGTREVVDDDVVRAAGRPKVESPSRPSRIRPSDHPRRQRSRTWFHDRADHAGQEGHETEAGTEYRFVISDRSSIHNFHLSGPGFNRVLTDAEFTGTKSFLLRLKRGSYRFVCDPHSGSMRGGFLVS